MVSAITKALSSDRVIDITTTGRKTGKKRRIEIWFHNIDSAIYITGSPGTRSWFANLLSQPNFTFHLKESVKADLQATAQPIFENAIRTDILAKITRNMNADLGLDEWVSKSPLVKVTFSDEDNSL